MEAVAVQDNRYDIFTSSINNFEFSDDHKRAIITVPLMHVGPNKKGLFWTANILKDISSMFRGIPFRYDLHGKEGSSHTINKLSSPYFDVGWTYSSPDGAWYADNIMWVRGEVTHPEVIDKLSRETTDGQREVNYASMGVIVEEAKCSICGADMPSNTCENTHTRLELYGGETCYKIPTRISKALHAALTNDPADGEAEIKNVIIQELGYEAAPMDKRNQAGEQMERSQLSNQMEGGMAPSSPQTGQPGSAPSPEVILKDLAERVKTLEQNVGTQTMMQSPELVNAAPQDQMTQDNMGVTSQFENPAKAEEGKMDIKDGQSSNAPTSVNPAKPETQDGMDPMSQIMGMLQQILQRLPGAEMQDMGKEALSAGKGQAKKSQDDLPTEHLGPGDAVGNTEDEGNAKNKANMQKPGMVATADDAAEEVVTAEVEPEEGLKEEVADLKSQMKKLRAQLEIQDDGNVPEFGGKPVKGAIDIADLGAEGRVKQFGEFGAWDSIFNGAANAQKFAGRQ